jgi:hypothetical protein
MRDTASIVLTFMLLAVSNPAFAGGIMSQNKSEWTRQKSTATESINKAGIYSETHDFRKDQAVIFAGSEQSNKEYLDVRGDNFEAAGYIKKSAESANSSNAASTDSLDANGYIVGGILIIPPVAVVAGAAAGIDVELESTDSASSASSASETLEAGLKADGQLTLTMGQVATQFELAGVETHSLNQSSKFLGVMTEQTAASTETETDSHTATSIGKSLF